VRVNEKVECPPHRREPEPRAPGGPWRSLEQVEPATAEWVDGWNQIRLHSAIGNVPPAVYIQHAPPEHLVMLESSHDHPGTHPSLIGERFDVGGRTKRWQTRRSFTRDQGSTRELLRLLLRAIHSGVLQANDHMDERYLRAGARVLYLSLILFLLPGTRRRAPLGRLDKVRCSGEML
jgi:hypothetical protein